MPNQTSIVASLAGVTKKYGQITALQDLSLNVHGGELLGLLGPNGAGKTTAIRLLLGLSKPSAGRATIFGQDPRNFSARGRIGAMLQVARVPETLKVKEHVNLFRSYYANPLSLPEALEIAGLEGLENRPFGALSGGQKQRVLFAIAICGDPDLLFLDEPTVGLDISSRQLIWQQIRRLVNKGRTVVLTTHYLEEIDALADRVVVLNHGGVVAEGTAAEIKSSTAQRKIRCRTQLTPAEIERIAQVNSVLERDNGVEIHTSQVEPVLRELLNRDLGLSGLEISGATLEEAFMKIVESKPVESKPVETGNRETTEEVTR